MEALKYPVTNKRIKIAYLSISLAILIFICLMLPLDLAYWGVIGLVAASYLVTVFGLDKDFRREEWIVIPLYSILISVIYYAWVSTAISSTWMAAIAAVGFGIIMYGLLLTLNILNLSTVRALPLARPANTVLSMIGLASGFGLFNLSLVNQPTVISWVLAVGGSTVLISWPLIWLSLGPKMRFNRSLIWTSFSALLMMELAIVVSFWPSSYATSLILSVVLFLILGIFHLQHKRQLNKASMRQYLGLGGVVLLVFILLTQW